MSERKILNTVGIGLAIVGALVLVSFIYKKRKRQDDNSNGKNIIIGDSQTPFIAKQSQNIEMLGKVGGEGVLWKGGMGLKWLKDAVSKYPVSKDVKNVLINIGTNG